MVKLYLSEIEGAEDGNLSALLSESYADIGKELDMTEGTREGYGN